MIEGPPKGALKAFGAEGEPRRLTGGKGGTWQAGDVVLKPAEGAAAETEWRAGVLTGLTSSSGFRIATQLPADDGSWVVDGWEATELVAGRTDPRRADEVIRAGNAFHEAIAALPRPALLDDRDDPWTWGERLAFGEPVPERRTAPSELLGPLIELRRPIEAREQLVHGDLTGNVLFADGLAPAIIDWPPYWRPPGWAAAVVAVDAVAWHGAGPDLLDRWAQHFPEWPQLLLRALVYRIASWPAARWTTPPDDAYRPVAELVRGLARAG